MQKREGREHKTAVIEQGANEDDREVRACTRVNWGQGVVYLRQTGTRLRTGARMLSVSFCTDEEETYREQIVVEDEIMQERLRPFSCRRRQRCRARSSLRVEFKFSSIFACALRQLV